MPSLKAIFTGDSRPLEQTLNRLPQHADRASRGIISRFIGVGSALGAIYKTLRFTQEAFVTDIATQRLENTFKSVTGSLAKARDELQFLRSEADRVGFVFLDTAQRVANFSAAAKEAGLSAATTRSIYTAVLEAGTSLGLSADRQSEALLALEQMISRGTIQSQELRQQWANSMPGGLNVFARAIGVTNGKLMEMVEAGQLLSNDVLPKVAEQLRKTFPNDPSANQSAKAQAAFTNSKNDFLAASGELLRGPGTLTLGTGAISLRGLAGLMKGDTWATMFRSAAAVESEKGRFRDLQRKLDQQSARAQAASDALPDYRVKPLTKSEQKEKDEIAKLEKKISDERERGSKIGETDLQKRARLTKEIAQLQRDIVGAPYEGVSDVELKTRQLRLTEKQNELKEIDPKSRGRFAHGAVNSLQQIGAYTSPAFVAQTDIARRQLSVLERIYENTRPGRGASATNIRRRADVFFGR